MTCPRVPHKVRVIQIICRYCGWRLDRRVRFPHFWDLMQTHMLDHHGKEARFGRGRANVEVVRA